MSANGTSKSDNKKGSSLWDEFLKNKEKLPNGNDEVDSGILRGCLDDNEKGALAWDSEKLSDQHDRMGDPLSAIQQLMVSMVGNLARGGSSYKMVTSIIFYIGKLSEQEKPIYYSLLATVICRMRDIRGSGGMGERALSFEALMALYEFDPVFGKVVLLHWCYDFGSLADLNRIFCPALVNSDDPAMKRLLVDIIEISMRTIHADSEMLKVDSKYSTTLMAKWLGSPPSSSKKGKGASPYKLFNHVAANWGVLHESPSEDNDYGKLIDLDAAANLKNNDAKSLRMIRAELNKHINPVEITMCNGEWKGIDHGKLTAGNNRVYKKALMFENIGPKDKRLENDGFVEDRKACAKNRTDLFQRAMDGDPRAKLNLVESGLLEPAFRAFDEGISNYPALNARPGSKKSKLELSEEERKTLNQIEVAFKSVIDALKEQILTTLKETCPEGVSMDVWFSQNVNMFVLADTSGSMSGDGSRTVNGMIPLMVAISMTLLITELTGDLRYINFNCRERTMFKALPKGDEFPFCQRFATMVNDSDWGGSTCIEAAYDLILETNKRIDKKHSKEDAALLYKNKLMIISDMQFDICENSREGNTVQEDLERKFTDSGYAFPKTYYWNVRSTSTEPVNAKSYNAVVISGWSEKVMTSTVDGTIKPVDPKEEPEKTVWDTTLEILNRPSYDLLKSDVVCHFESEGDSSKDLWNDLFYSRRREELQKEKLKEERKKEEDDVDESDSS